jgi:hypothetical protein
MAGKGKPGRKNSTRTEEEWREYHNARQRAYYAKHREKMCERKMELYYEKKERDIQADDKQ